MDEKSMDDRPFFSVVMPVRNVKKYLDECIGSVLGQTFADLELIIVDDGSTDGCGAICDEYAARDGRCRVIHQENKGLLAARRAGIKETSGAYLINVDSDDKCLPTMLEELKRIIDEKDPDMIIFNYSDVSDEGEITLHAPYFEEELTRLEKPWLLRTFVSSLKVNTMWTKCTKLSLVDKEDDYSDFGRLNMAEDELQSTALYKKAESVYYYSRPVYLYRNNRNSITKKTGPQAGIDSIRAKSRIVDMLRSCGADESTFDLFFRTYYHTVNVYLLRNVNSFDSFEEYKKYRNVMKAYDVGGLKRAKLTDRVVYKLLFSESPGAAKTLASLYGLKKKAKR